MSKLIGWFDDKGTAYCPKHAPENASERDDLTPVYSTDTWAADVGLCSESECGTLIADLAVPV